MEALFRISLQSVNLLNFDQKKNLCLRDWKRRGGSMSYDASEWWWGLAKKSDYRQKREGFKITKKTSYDNWMARKCSGKTCIAMTWKCTLSKAELIFSSSFNTYDVTNDYFRLFVALRFYTVCTSCGSANIATVFPVFTLLLVAKQWFLLYLRDLFWYLQA